ncbi:hypothetical protein [Tepidibacter mesophilus]|uniref:hypothetical protein n=1 Tax=Tepidibacter mesophilus TaxID=655607 RepID=UPI000C08059B|nr:hypothetical protein [Tepidibacter mesophilus]
MDNMCNRKIIIFIIVLISLIKKIKDIQGRNVLLRLKDKSISTIFFTFISCIVLIISIVELVCGEFNEGVSSLSTAIIVMTGALGGNSRYCISEKGVILDHKLYRWNAIKSWRFEDSLMNEVVLELDDSEIKFVAHQEYREYNEYLESLLNKYIA